MKAAADGTRGTPRPGGRAAPRPTRTARTARTARTVRTACIAWTVAGLAVVAGCGVGSDEPMPGAASFERWDSAGVQIARTSGDVLQHPLPWVLDTVPDLEIGTRDGEAPYQFTRISNLVALPGGEIVVADQRTLGLRWFDDQGAFVRSVGSRGQGPGEFMSVRLIPQFRPDSLVVFDAMQRRLTSMGTDGQNIRAYSVGGSSRPAMGDRPMGAYAGRVAFITNVSGCGSGDGICEVDALVIAADPRTTSTDTLAVTTQRYFRITASGMQSVLTIPFDPVVSAATDDQGLLLSVGEAFEILRFGPDGGLEGVLRIDGRPAVLEEEDLEVAIRPFLQGSFEEREVRGWFSQMEIRERRPAFQTLRVDPLGWTWAELWRSGESEPGAWAVFDPSGQAHGTITLPRDFVLHDIGEDFVIGAFTDALGVPHVRRYPLQRSPDVPPAAAAETGSR